MPKRYNTPHRSRVVKTRLSEDEYADFTARLAPYGKIRKSADKHFEGLAALSTHSVGRRVAVKAGCKPVHFSLDGYPLSCYFSGSVATTSGHFVHKSERRTRDGGFHIRPVC